MIKIIFKHTDTVPYVLLKTLAFPPAEHYWALELGFQCGRGEKARSHAFFFRAWRFRFFRAFFLRAFELFFSSRFRALFLLRARELESVKKTPAPTSR